MQLLRTLVGALAVLSSASYSFAHTIDIPAAAKECFFEDLHREDKVRVPQSFARTFERGGRAPKLQTRASTGAVPSRRDTSPAGSCTTCDCGVF